MLSPLQGVNEQNTIRIARGLDNYPNPADVRTTIRYELSRACPVSVHIHDASGRRVAELVDTRQETGSHSAVWYSSDAPGGVYYCTLTAGGQSSTRPIVVNH